MKYALLVSRSLSNGSVSGMKNIGDYIQSLAAAQYMPRIDEYFDKTAKDFGTQTVKMIMNAWYIWNPELFPVSKRVIPLPISMHISPFVYEKFFKVKNNFEWFKKNEPIGCRDKETLNFLKVNGIEAYFSGCLTLTLGMHGQYKSNNERKGLVVVDAYLSNPKAELKFTDFLRLALIGLLHPKACLKISKKIQHTYCPKDANFVRKFLCALVMIKTYKKIFSIKQLQNAEYVTHLVKVGENTCLNSEAEKLDYAESLLKKYASAKIVVTSRIHCALPCLALETPVLFTTGSQILDESPTYSTGRFDGLIELFNVACIKGLKIVDAPVFPVKNKDAWKPLAQKLQRQCEEFMRE